MIINIDKNISFWLPAKWWKIIEADTATFKLAVLSVYYGM